MISIILLNVLKNKRLEKAKNLQNVFKSNLNDISKGRFKSEEQKRTLANIKLLYKSREAVSKLFNDYSLIVSEAKYNSIHGEGIPSISADTVAHGRVAKVYDCKVSDHSNVKVKTCTSKSR